MLEVQCSKSKRAGGVLTGIESESWVAPLPDLESGRETEKTEVESETTKSVCARM